MIDLIGGRQIKNGLRKAVDSMNETQKQALKYLIGKAIENTQKEFERRANMAIVKWDLENDLVGHYIHTANSPNLPCCSALLNSADDRAKLEREKDEKQKKTFAETPYKILSEPEKIIKNGPVVIVFWKDKTKTMVRKKPDDPDDIYSAVAQAIMKKWCGSTSHAHKWIDKLLVNKEESR